MLYRHPLVSPYSHLALTDLRLEAHGGHCCVQPPQVCGLPVAHSRRSWCLETSAASQNSGLGKAYLGTRLVSAHSLLSWGRELGDTLRQAAQNTRQMLSFLSVLHVGGPPECPNCVGVCLPPWLSSRNSSQSFIVCQAEALETQKSRTGFAVLCACCHPVLRECMRDAPAACTKGDVNKEL